MVSLGSTKAPSSRGSLRSSYRTVSKNSNVDESLFGSSKPGSRTGRPQNVAVIDNTHTGFLFGGEAATTISSRDLRRMRAPAAILTPEEIARQKKEVAAKREAEAKITKVRKDKMLSLAQEAKSNAPKTQTEKIDEEKQQATISRASKLMEEEHDDVKRMNQMMLYSKCVTIRDAQIEEKKQIKSAEEAENKRLDMIFEMERVKAIDAYADREAARQVDRRKGADVIKQQIAERQKERIKQEELRDQERKHMLQEIERLRQEEEAAAVAKRVQGLRLLEEVAIANATQIERKKDLLNQEREEEERITLYIKRKEAKEQAQALEEARIAKAKELEIAHLRAQQERAQDKQAEIDEIRARRYEESAERQRRSQVKAASQKQHAMQLSLSDAREEQRLMKLKQLADTAKTDHNEFVRILHANREKEQADYEQFVHTKQVSQNHKEELLAQISANKESRNKAREEYLEEGRKLREDYSRERVNLEVVKDRKLEELQVSGVPAKYRAELERKKISNW